MFRFKALLEVHFEADGIDFYTRKKVVVTRW
jgi:hypothetical protein